MAAATEVSKLCKSRSDRMIDGVCGGVGEYLGVDSSLVRLGFIFLAFLGGLGVVLYVAAMIIMPTGSATTGAAGSKEQGKFFGIVLIILGALLLLGKVGVSFWQGWWRLPWAVVIPVVFIIAGIAVLASAGKRGEIRPAGPDASTGPGVSARPVNGTSRLYRSRTDKKISGVCGGIGTYLNTDPTLVRILFVLAALASAGLMILLYIIMALVVPVEPAATASPSTAA